jgi:hypothetical protein
MSDDISSLATAADYQAAREHIFPSTASLDWFIRRHRNRLADAGAILKFARQWRLHPARFDTQVLTIGQEQAVRTGAAE